MSGVEGLVLGPLLNLTKSTSKGLFKLVQRIRHAPREFEDLQEEIDDFRMFLEALQYAGVESGSKPISAALVVAVKRIGKGLLELNQMVTYELTQANAESSVNRTAWARKASHAKALLDRLQKLRAGVNALLGIDIR